MHLIVIRTSLNEGDATPNTHTIVWADIMNVPTSAQAGHITTALYPDVNRT